MPDIVEAALNHASIRNQLAATYNRARYRPQVAAALQLLADALDGTEAGARDVVLPVTLNSAPRHAPIRQALTLETGAPSRSKSAPHHTPNRHLFRRHLGTHLSGSLLTTKVYIA